MFSSDIRGRRMGLRLLISAHHHSSISIRQHQSVLVQSYSHETKVSYGQTVVHSFRPSRCALRCPSFCVGGFEPHTWLRLRSTRGEAVPRSWSSLLRTRLYEAGGDWRGGPMEKIRKISPRNPSRTHTFRQRTWVRPDKNQEVPWSLLWFSLHRGTPSGRHLFVLAP